ncbi:MAG TPA: ABC transporter permease [Acidobacteriaceae bacterium]|jgi:predicted permease|nr:ABC transporter permease [Acidobacteriaceae bacterium]
MLFGRDKAGAQLDSELRFHLDQQIAENIAAGMSAKEARNAALRTFGNPGAIREQARETWSWNSLDLLLVDLRQSIRSLRRDPSFSIVAILVLALGIGANIALFTVVHSVLLKPLPFIDSDRLVRIYEADAHGRFKDNIVAGGVFAIWKTQSKSFTDLAIKRSAGYSLSEASKESNGAPPEFVSAEISSWNLFPLLGVQPALGRFFSADEDRPGANGTVVLSWGLWKRRYGGDPAVLGRTIDLDARPFTVVGVLPADFTYPDAKVQLWAPLYHEKSPEMMQMIVAHNFDVVGRLKPGVSMAQASSELNTIQRRIREQNPTGPVNDAANLRPILDAEVYGVKSGLYALLAATGCLLFIACLNIASLLVARAATRRKELAIRTALGGSRARLIRSQVLESLLLSAAGGVIGAAFAYAGLEWLVAVRTDIPRAGSIHIDVVTLVFALGAVLVCGLVAGLIPALASSDRKILNALQESSRGNSGGAGRVGLRRALLAAEVGVSVVLLVGAGLLLKTYEQMRAVNLGCTTHNILTLDLTLPKGSYNNGVKRVAFAERLTERVFALPGVHGVGLTTTQPGEGYKQDDVFTIPEHPAPPQGQVLDAATVYVDPGYFQTMQIPLLSGRLFEPTERLDQARAVIVNQALAKQYFPGENPIGKHIVSDALRDGKAYEIAGVVGDTREKLTDPARGAIYFPFYLGESRVMTLDVRASGDPSALALPIQKIIAGIDHDLPVASILTMDQVVGQATLQASFDALLLAAFAVFSLILAALGLFGVLSYIVAQRTSEIGIRIALGAQREQVLRTVLFDGLRPAVTGLVAGLIASAIAARLIQSILYGTKPYDPAIFATVAVTLLLVAALACLVPAWRASRLDPMQALRVE